MKLEKILAFALKAPIYNPEPLKEMKNVSYVLPLTPIAWFVLKLMYANGVKIPIITIKQPKNVFNALQMNIT